MARVRSQKRIEKNERTREDLFQAALQIVGDFGYAKASIAKIAETAGVSIGTFYLHFAAKEQIYDQLLPWANRQLTAQLPLVLQPGESYMTFEERNIRGFFAYADESPQFATVMLEAEVAAPKGWENYQAVREAAYITVLDEAWERGEFPDYRRDELSQVCTMLMGLRKSLVQRYARGNGTPRAAIDTYLQFVFGALHASNQEAMRDAWRTAPATLRRAKRPKASKVDMKLLSPAAEQRNY